jgi:CheY-like chemotaxis protein
VGTVLVVDDEFGIVEVLEAALSDAGYRVFTAIHGRQGLERLHEAKPDLVLVDFMMPVLNGPGMLRAMAEDEPYRHIPVVIMSALPEATVAQATGAYAGFIRKPFRLRDLMEMVERLLKNSAWAGLAGADRSGR